MAVSTSTTLQRLKQLQRERPRYPGALRCRRKLLRIFPGGFRDESYVSWERSYKWEAHVQ
jgi:hypothetical protein